MKLFRYNCTLEQAGCPSVTIALVAKTTAQAREKANFRFSGGIPFISWRLSDIKIRKLESVSGPVLLVFP